jgi:transcriptional regulator with XRE-family HTH domain
MGSGDGTGARSRERTEVAVEPTTAVPASTLGATLRRVRRGRGLTLVRLADLADLSHPFLSQLERGLARPSMASLDRIAAALGTSAVELLAGESERREQVDSHVLRADEGVTGAYGLGTARLLGPELLSFVPMEVRGANAEAGALHHHAEDEFLTVLDGVVRIDLGDRTHELGAGDSATVAAGTPHRWWSPDGSPYRLLVVKEAQGVARLHEDLRGATEVPEDWS